MAHLVDNSFSTYELTKEEELQGNILTIAQQQVIQNRLATAAEEKLTLEFDPAEPNLFMQQEAYKRAEIDTLRFILDTSKASEAILRDPNYHNLLA